MKVLKPGHSYELANFEQDIPELNQRLHFIDKAPCDDESGKLVTVRDGTTNEEVLEMLIDRLKFLQGAFPCRENAIVITKLEESLMWLNKRTADRAARGVEGKHLK
jgi:hypothetical protein